MTEAALLELLLRLETSSSLLLLLLLPLLLERATCRQTDALIERRTRERELQVILTRTEDASEGNLRR